MLQEALAKTGGPLTKKEREWVIGILAEPKRRAVRNGKAV